LDKQLLKEAGYHGDYTKEFSLQGIQSVSSLRLDGRTAPYADFLRKCNEHRPWIWKDPRLWLTIRYWKALLDLDDCRFIHLTRNQFQAWVGQTLRRNVWTYQYFKNYDNNIRRSIVDFLNENQLPCLHLCYEDLILDPATVVGKMNSFLNTRLTVEDLAAVYNKPLYKKPRSRWDLLVALAIYVKNYRERLR
jgi:hypothetical protein